MLVWERHLPDQSLHHPIYQRTEVYNSDLQKIATDIGVPCSHPNLVRWHKHRYWGLLICACPCINGTERLSGGEDWYDDKARAIVRKMTKRDPSLRDKFAGRVLKNHDWKYLQAFVQQVQALRDGKTAMVTEPRQRPRQLPLDFVIE